MNLTGDDKSILVVDDRLRLAGIPADSHRYEVNGRTSFVWIIYRYRIPKNCPSGILKDPNAWFPDEDAFIAVVLPLRQDGANCRGSPEGAGGILSGWECSGSGIKGL